MLHKTIVKAVRNCLSETLSPALLEVASAQISEEVMSALTEGYSPDTSRRPKRKKKTTRKKKTESFESTELVDPDEGPTVGDQPRRLIDGERLLSDEAEPKPPKPSASELGFELEDGAKAEAPAEPQPEASPELEELEELDEDDEDDAEFA